MNNNFPEVNFEADREELMAILDYITPSFVEKEHIDAVVRALPLAKATLLHQAPLREDGSRRCEIHGDEIIVVKTAEQADGHGIAEGVVIPMHLKVYMKPCSGLLSELENLIGLEAKAG